MDNEAGKLFHKEARQDASICRSGVRLLDKVYKTVTKSNPLKLDMAEQKMASTVYFTGGMTIDQTKLAAAQFKSDHTELGSRRSQDELAVYKAMLKELPPKLQDPQSTVVRDLLWEMEEASMNSEPLISFDKLVTKIAIMLRNVQGAANKAKEVNSTAEGEASITMYPLCAGGAHGLMQLQGHKASGARRNIVPPQLLEKSLGATINYHATKYGPPSYDVAFPSGEEWLVLEYNDLFFAFVKVGNEPVLPRNVLKFDTLSVDSEINEAEINSAGMLCSVDPKIWATRLVTGADGVKR